jgi:phospholipase C
MQRFVLDTFARTARMGLLAVLAAVIFCALEEPAITQESPQGISQIQHIVFIIKENRGFDHMFGLFPGVEGTNVGKISTGQIIPLSRAPDSMPRDLCHTWNCNIVAFDGGRMDKWDVTIGSPLFACSVNGDYACYSQYTQADLPNYWNLASTYTIADHMFSSIHATSFPQHVYTVAAQNAGIIGQPHLISDTSQGESGCKSDPGSTVNVLAPNGDIITPFPCFDITTMTDSLENAGLSWSYYSPDNSPYNALEAVNHIRNVPTWTDHVFRDPQFVTDVQLGKLSAVTWINTSDQPSEHPPWSECQGENWTMTQVSAIMNSSFWSSTAIVIVWDDNGGFYDHIFPPQVDQWGLGPRVPMLIVSPFAKPGVRKTQYEFSSVLKFMEKVFGLPAIAARDADDKTNSIEDAFDFTQTPLPPINLPQRTCSPISTTSLQFSPQQAGTQSQSKDVTVYNFADSALVFDGITLSGSDFVQTNNNCPPSLPPPSPGVRSCAVSIAFKPTQQGPRTGTLTIADHFSPNIPDPGSPHQIALTGNGTNVSLSPSTLSYGTLQLFHNKILSAVLKNQGTSPISISSIVVSAGDFTQSNNCGSNLPPGGQCTITATFTPTVTGTRYSSVTITDSDGASPQVLNLTGIGTLVSVSPATLNFPATAVGKASAPQLVTLTNNGAAALGISRISIQGSINQDYFDYTQTNNCGTSLGAGLSCSVNVKLVPTSQGPRNGRLVIDHSEINTTPLSVVLTGTGTANAVPLINDPLVPTIAAPGGASFTLTVNGTGFVSGATVNWNGTALATTFVSASQLTATVPASNIATAGAALLRVTNPVPGGGTSNLGLFEVTTGSTPTGLIKSDIVTGTAPTGLARADFNGDSKLDLAIANSGSNTLSILLGNGDGTFTLKSTPATGHNPTAVAAGDFNADGKVDLAVANQVDSTLTILLGAGDGTFIAQPVAPATGAGPVAVSADDFDQDGRLDLATTNNVENYGSALSGDGDGTFTLLNEGVNTGHGPLSLAVGDFNADGFLDLAVVNNLDNTISILPGNGDGSFTSIDGPTPGNAPSALAAGDLNNDGKLDLAVANLADSTISVFLGIGDGTFVLQTTVATGTGPNSITLGDFNGDGKVDLATADSTSNKVSILLGNGDGTFQSHLDAATGTTPNSLVAGDFNRDGRLDLAVTDNAANTVSILLQPNGTGGPQISFNPASLTFATQLINTSSATQTVVVTNSGTATLHISRINISGNFGKQNHCGKLLAAGASCSVDVAFTPTAKGTRTGSLTFNDDAPASPQSVPLTGTGTVVQLVPPSVDFGDQKVGTKSAPQVVTLTNKDTGPLRITGMAVTGANPTDFARTTTCSFTNALPPGANCTISISFKPAAIGPRSASLGVKDNGGGSPQLIPLTGNGTN